MPKRKRKQDPFEIEIQPLVISESSANETGAIFINFNKPIFTPTPYQDLKKKLKDNSTEFDDQLD